MVLCLAFRNRGQLRWRRSLPLVAHTSLCTSSIEVDPVTAHGHSPLEQQLALAPPYVNASVRSDHTMPRKVLVRGRQHPPDQTRRRGLDVAVGLDGTDRNFSDAVDDARNARLLPRTLNGIWRCHRDSVLRCGYSVSWRASMATSCWILRARVSGRLASWIR